MKKFLFTFLLFSCLSFLHAQHSTLNRPEDPLVITGSNLLAFIGIRPADIVGFRFTDGLWEQIPVQVDERCLLDIVAPYGSLAVGSSYTPSPANPKLLFYCDTSTNIGADPDSTFDSDDELVFMLKDAGGHSDGSVPQGVIAGICSELEITDPNGGSAYVYLFVNVGGLHQNAGGNYVSVVSNLLTTALFPAHLSGTNSENTTISTLKYTWHFSAEWVCDILKVATGNNADILDRYKNFFSNSTCVRTEDTFSSGENAFICIKSGPVRAIRSYMGANSGPLTQRTHLFYQDRQDIRTDLRVHHIASVYDVFDYSSAANGMIYKNSMDTSGVLINGIQDTLQAGILSWEQVSGSQGTVSVVLDKYTDMTTSEINFVSYYDDNSANPASDCTGDGQAWGCSGSGVIFTNANVCTDPMGNNCAGTQWLRSLYINRIIYIDSGNQTVSLASAYHHRYLNPVTFVVSNCPIDTTYTLSTFSEPLFGGTTTGDSTYRSGSIVTAEAFNSEGFIFLSWTENGDTLSFNNQYTFQINADRVLKASFVPSVGVSEKTFDAGSDISIISSEGFITVKSPLHSAISIYNSDGICTYNDVSLSGTTRIKIDTDGFYIIKIITAKGCVVNKKVIGMK